MELDFWKIAMRPGKPLMFGRLGATRVHRPARQSGGQPGLLAPVPEAADRAARRPAARRPTFADAVLGAAMAANDLTAGLCARRGRRSGPRGLVATPFGIQDSSMLKTLADANGLIVRPPHRAGRRRRHACPVLMLR